MSNKVERYDLLLVEEYEKIDDEGNKNLLPSWTRVGVAFPLESGKGFSLQIKNNLSVSGRVIMRKYEPKDERGNDE